MTVLENPAASAPNCAPPDGPLDPGNPNVPLNNVLIVADNLNGSDGDGIVEPFPAARAMIVDLNGSGAIDNIVLGFCGDETLDPGEECDDGNTFDGDGCDSSCQVEDSPCEIICHAKPVCRGAGDDDDSDDSDDGDDSDDADDSDDGVRGGSGNLMRRLLTDRTRTALTFNQGDDGDDSDDGDDDGDDDSDDD